jgi:hypothetical protein
VGVQVGLAVGVAVRVSVGVTVEIAVLVGVIVEASVELIIWGVGDVLFCEFERKNKSIKMITRIAEMINLNMSYVCHFLQLLMFVFFISWT